MERLLELVIELLKELPEMAIWVLVIIAVYKVVVVGSIYSVSRLLINKAHDAIIKWRESPRKIVHECKIKDMTCMCEDELMVQLRRLVSGMGCIHKKEVLKLAKAIDEYEKSTGKKISDY